VVLAAVAYALGLGYEAVLWSVAIATVAYVLRFMGAFAVFFVRVARHPERHKYWQASARRNGNYILLDLKRLGGPDHVYGHRCAVEAPTGGIHVARDEKEAWLQDVGHRTFLFLYGGINNEFTGDPELISGPYRVTWELRFKPGGPWQEVVHDRDVTITLPCTTPAGDRRGPK